MINHDVVVDAGTWLDQEQGRCVFSDIRLGKRFRWLLEHLWSGLGDSIPLVCQDWANTKAAYRFFSNERVSEEQILAGHFQSTADRFAATQGSILVLQDTTEFSFQRENLAAIGTTHIATGRKKDGRHMLSTVCGLLMHASLAVTPEGLPLGLAAIKFWSRKKFKEAKALQKKINPTRVPIEQKESVRWLDNLKQSTALFHDPQRCIHIGDRESDIYELFCAAQEVNTHFLVRTCVDRLAGDGDHTVADEMAEVKVKGLHRVEVRDKLGNSSTAVLELKFRRVRVQPPIGKQKRYPELTLTVIHAQERGAPKSRDPVDWKLITDLPVTSRKEAIEKLDWYAMRWKIETFHKILKSGCKIEQSKLRTAERLVNLIAVFCILSWRIFWMTMMNRLASQAPPTWVFTTNEIKLLDYLVKDKSTQATEPKYLSHYLIKLACIGGYLARTCDPPPGNIVIWRGMSRLIDIEFGFMAALEIVGN